MRTLAAFSLVVGFAVLAEAQDKKKEKYVNKDRGYAVAFPEEPKLSEQKNETKSLKTKTYTAAWTSADKSYHMDVAVTPFPIPKEKFDVKKALDAMAKVGSGTDFNVTEAKEFEFSDKKLPGRIVHSVREDKKFWARSKLIFHADSMTLFNVCVMGTSKAIVNGPEADAFFDSFELTAK